MEQKKGFWRNFTIKKWIVISIIAFLVFTSFDIIDARFIEKQELNSLITTKWILKRILTPFLFGFWMAVWMETPAKNI